MDLKSLFVENNKNRYKNIKRVKKENISLIINPIGKIKENWIILLGIFVVIIGFLLINFNSKIFSIALALLITTLIVFVYGNKTNITCDKNTLNIKQGFQFNKIPYSNLKNIFIGRSTKLLLFLPIYNYNIVIRYEDNISFIHELQFSLFCANEDDVKKFIENFEFDDNINQRFIQFERKKILLKIISAILTIAIMIFIFFYFISDSNISNII